jgi:hypothetical protein
MSGSGGVVERRYDKGERRYKHVGKTSQPEFHHPEDNPKRVVGKCPNNIPDADRDTLLAAAISPGNGDRDLNHAERQSDDRLKPVVLDDPTPDVAFALTGIAGESDDPL